MHRSLQRAPSDRRETEVCVGSVYQNVPPEALTLLHCGRLGQHYVFSARDACEEPSCLSF